MGVAIGDIDNDGDADVYASNYGADRLYRCRGDGTFEEITEASGIDVGGWSASASFFDYDRDGYLDLFVARYVNHDPPRGCSGRAGRLDYCAPQVFDPVLDVLLHNNGDGTFTDVSTEAGIRSVPPANGLGVICEDLDDDGWIDVYVANDGHPNHLWINQGDGTFQEAGLLTGSALNVHGQAEAGMGIVACDFDDDLHLDLFMTHQSKETNTLYKNLGGDRGFADVSGESGLGDTSWAYTGFGTAAFDVELDGDQDLVVVGGRVRLGDPWPDAEIEPPWDRLAEPNLFYLNDGSGRFTLACTQAAAICAPVEVSRGLSVADIDRDGDLDVLVANAQGPARLYRNDAPPQGHWLNVRAVDPALQRGPSRGVSAIAPAATRARTSAWARPRRSMPSRSAGPTGRSSAFPARSSTRPWSCAAAAAGSRRHGSRTLPSPSRPRWKWSTAPRRTQPARLSSPRRYPNSTRPSSSRAWPSSCAIRVRRLSTIRPRPTRGGRSGPPPTRTGCTSTWCPPIDGRRSWIHRASGMSTTSPSPSKRIRAAARTRASPG
jgi:hypothetical protein